MSALLAPFIFVKSQPVAILACIVANAAIGMLWYGPLFRKPWEKLSGMSKVPKQKLKKQMFPAITVSVIAALIQASVLGTLLSVIPTVNYLDLLSILLLIWIPFTASILAVNYAYTMKPVKLLLIDIFYPLVSWAAMSIIFLYVHM